MGDESEDLNEHHAEQLIEDISCRVFGDLHDAGRIERMTKPVATRTFRQAITATLSLQREGSLPSDAELERRGGPPSDTMSRLMRCADLSALPVEQLGGAVQAGLAPTPSRVIVEARTEEIRGPDKYGVAHIKPPPGLIDLDPALTPLAGRASNTIGGISCALVLADCGEVIFPVGAIAIAQEYWDPAHWNPTLRKQAERLLRARGEVRGPFVTTPAQVATEIGRLLGSGPTTAAWGGSLGGLPILGGRLRLGFPRSSAVHGTGNRERYIGCCLTAVTELSSHGLIPFLSLPGASDESPVLTCTYETCDWRFQFGQEQCDLRGLQERLKDSRGPWVRAPERLTRRFAGPNRHIFTLEVIAHSQNICEPVTVVATLEHSGRRELFVTTLKPAVESELALIVELADFEIERGRVDSPSELAIRELLARSYLQTNRRRRYPDRRNFAGLAQAASALRTLARVA